MAAVRQNGLALKHVSIILRDNFYIMHAAVQQTPRAIEHAGCVKNSVKFNAYVNHERRAESVSFPTVAIATVVVGGFGYCHFFA
jgi:hypothetical protein